MPASLSVRVSASCNGTGQGELTVELINYAAGETVTVDIAIAGGGYSVEFPTETSPHLITGVANGVYIVTATGTTSGTGSVYMNGSGTVSLDGEIEVNCTPTGGGGGIGVCDVAISSITITPGDGETATTATVNATGSGTLEYSLNGGAFQSSNVFTVEPGTYIATVRMVGDTDCSAATSFLVTAPDTLALASVTPTRDWLPVGQDIIYIFESPNATPQPLAIRIEVSSNGINFSSPVTAGVLILAPDSNKQYTANVAPYLEAMFNPTNPTLSGQDYALFKRYRIVAGELPGFNGTTGTPEITTPDAFCLYATELTPVTSGFITLTKAPAGVNSAAFSGIETAVFLSTNELRTRSIAYDTENPNPQTCFKYPIQLYWLNRAGGWQTWVFDGKHEYEEETGEGTYWKDANDLTHLASLPGITEKVQVFSGFIPLSAYNTVFGLLSAIRVYHRDNNVWREVNIETGSNLKHKEGLRRKELNFSFTYAQSLTVQNA